MRQHRLLEEKAATISNKGESSEEEDSVSASQSNLLSRKHIRKISNQIKVESIKERYVVLPNKLEGIKLS